MKKLFVSLFLSFAAMAAVAQGDALSITREKDGLGFAKPLPVSLSGFSGEVDSVLRFDLMFMGFEFVAPEKARFNIRKNNGAGVGATVIDPLQQNKAIYNKVFTGGSTRQQTHALADDLCKALTGLPGIASTRIAAKVQMTGVGAGEIFVADFDGFNATPVTADKVICSSPSWVGPRSLVYMSHKVGDKPAIFFHDLNSGSRRVVANFPGSNFTPAASPDGSKVAMILGKSGSPDLYVANIDGSGLKQLTKTRELEATQCWSPDGSTICFVSESSGKRALYTLPAGGGSPSRLPVAGAPNPTDPAWSPDGKYIVFTSQRGGGFDIWIAVVDGPARGQAFLLVEGEDPVWAPNSRTVMFVRTVNHRRVLALLDVPTKQVREINRLPGSASQPSWAE